MISLRLLHERRRQQHRLPRFDEKKVTFDLFDFNSEAFLTAATRSRLAGSSQVTV